MSAATGENRSDARLMLALESSCDETASAIIERDLTVRSNVVASQAELHEKYGGVVPEIASRAHVTNLLPVVQEAVTQAGITLKDIDLIAVVTRPGLVGSLLVGLTAAKTFAATLNVPLIAVDHVQAHLYACRIAAKRDLFPAIGLVVSGGHTNLYLCKSATEYELIGSTIDDAAGEAFDKVAKILKLPYPGGPHIERVAADGNPSAFKFVRTFIKEDRLDFSFSGLKTAVLYQAEGTPGAVKQPPPLDEQRINDLAASFQEAVVDVLVGKCKQALEQYQLQTLLIGGGVAANGRFRSALEEAAQENNFDLHISPREFCTDNAGMAAIAWEHYERGELADLKIDVTPGLVRKS
ncbi:tRNA N6-adenosine threonylcarbamoyltransferase [Polystyrenella longa]|uniref:tRNA N6-adenosine threonylcarbamoyltransferase n=1 Tax=Polystyrenella longa TaxID=2528007 RepID=A0A518CS66_9PLAN|nr:tRNA (adenosine(37)-N6)-threonylcarbamoyltransferase complex transferase subunit TsaD [Polystyrenella longa]QDU82062.1 tRNA N6-adenosine threonylcarbamoyltransferase [Polystyrenella longa]